MLGITGVAGGGVALNVYWMEQFSGPYRALSLLQLESESGGYDPAWTFALCLIGSIFAAVPVLVVWGLRRPRWPMAERQARLLALAPTFAFALGLWGVLLAGAGLAVLGEGSADWSRAVTVIPFDLRASSPPTLSAGTFVRPTNFRSRGHLAYSGQRSALLLAVVPHEDVSVTGGAPLVLELASARDMQAQTGDATGLVLGRVPGGVRWAFERVGEPIAEDAWLVRVGATPADALLEALPLGLALLFTGMLLAGIAAGGSWLFRVVRSPSR
ncbi:MAG: hypothetical protein Q8P18_03265 [Pseudomonadota bacterium]|nr:hypothetical protein [Pseudomonadota bacterium]